MHPLQAFIPFIYDGITFIVFLSIMITCWRMGFARVITGFIGCITATVVAATTAQPLGKALYSLLFRTPVVKMVESRLAGADMDTLPSALYALIKALPQGLLAAAGFEKETLTEHLRQLVIGNQAGAAGIIADVVVQPILVLLLKMVLFLLIFWIVMFFVNKLVWMFYGINRVPVIGSVNRVLGLAVGFLEAAVVMLVVAVLLSILASFSVNGLGLTIQGQRLVLISHDLFQRTVLFRPFIVANPLGLIVNAAEIDWEALGAAGTGNLSVAGLLESLVEG